MSPTCPFHLLWMYAFLVPECPVYQNGVPLFRACCAARNCASVTFEEAVGGGGGRGGDGDDGRGGGGCCCCWSAVDPTTRKKVASNTLTACNNLTIEEKMGRTCSNKN